MIVASASLGQESVDTLDPAVKPQWLSGRKFGAFSTLIAGCCTLISGVWWLGDERASFMALGWTAAFVVGLPFLRRSSSLLSPWSFVLASVYIGSAIRGTFISFGVEGPARSLDTLFLLGHGPEYFVGPSMLHLAGVVALTVGYTALTSGEGSELTAQSAQRPGRKLGRRTPLVVLILAGVGFVAFVLYARATGGLDLSSLSAKRTSINGLNLSDDYASHGGLRFLNGFSAAAFWLAVAYVGVTRSSGSGVGLRGVVVVVLALNAVLLPFYASSRSDAAFTVLVAGAIYFAFGGRLSGRRVVMGVAILVALIAVMTFLRGADGKDDGSLSGAVLESFVYNRNFGDMQNTSHIVQNVPEVIPFQNGETMAGYLLAPIPRSIWPDKPIINAGPLLGVHIYGTSGSGVPAGLFGDLYLNFGIGGVFIGALVAGGGLGIVDRWRRRLSLDRPIWVVVYCTIGFRLGLFVMNKGVAFAVFKGAMELVPVLVALYLASSAVPAVRRRS